MNKFVKSFNCNLINLLNFKCKYSINNFFLFPFNSIISIDKLTQWQFDIMNSGKTTITETSYLHKPEDIAAFHSDDEGDDNNDADKID